MKCNYCGKEYSDKIIDIHTAHCKELSEKELTEEEIRKLAKKQGIKSWHVKAIDTLKEELSEME
jgi:hypothetical protein